MVRYNNQFYTMELLDNSKLDEIAFNAINQRGYGDEIDRYIYSQSGEGLASFFGKLAKKAIPILGKAIKGAAKAAVPHLQEAAAVGASSIIDSVTDNIPSKLGKQAIQEVGKRAVQEVVNINHRPHKRRVKGL